MTSPLMGDPLYLSHAIRAYQGIESYNFMSPNSHYLWWVKETGTEMLVIGC